MLLLFFAPRRDFSGVGWWRRSRTHRTCLSDVCRRFGLAAAVVIVRPSSWRNEIAVSHTSNVEIVRCISMHHRSWVSIEEANQDESWLAQFVMRGQRLFGSFEQEVIRRESDTTSIPCL